MKDKKRMSNIRFVKTIDFFASFLIKSGGVLVIGCVALIILMIFKVALPLFFQPQITLTKQYHELDSTKNIFVGLGEYKDSFFVVTDEGTVKIYSFKDSAKQIQELKLFSEKSEKIVVRSISAEIYVAYTASGSVAFFKVHSVSIREGEKRINKLKAVLLCKINLNSTEEIKALDASVDLENGFIVNTVLIANKLYVKKYKVDFEELNSELEEPIVNLTHECKSKDSIFLTIASNGESIWLGASSGLIEQFRFQDDELKKCEELQLNRPISAMELLYGDQTLAIGFQTGQLETYMVARLDPKKEEKSIIKSHDLLQGNVAITKIISSYSDKSLLAHDSSGELYQFHFTTESTRFNLKYNANALFAFSPKGDGLILSKDSNISIFDIDDPHRDISFGVLFKRTFYEGYSKPEFIWQSGGGGDDGEAKLSLVPLIFGTLKGTFYAMIFSIPLALGCAVYVSQFASPSVRSVVKPAIELMSAVPSVVVGFIAALWLAPVINDNFFFMICGLPMFILVFVFSLFLWGRFAPAKLHKGAEFGWHLFYLIPVFLITFALLFLLCPIIENLFYAGNFKDYFIRILGIDNFEQRNCIIIGFALGFAVIPIIFTISEDMLSSVPRSLMANSLALGANRWQSVWRVILPSGSPGIIAGIIVGFGRAIGETMIIVMATGNTAIMDMSIFNGMRTLSANIAVEIGEASHNSSLYRTLFLSAVVLFSMTIFLNTGAELIRHKLRKKFSQF